MPLTAVVTRRRLSAGNTFLGGHVQSRLQSCRSSGFSPRKPRLAPLRPGTKKTSQRLIFRFPAQNFFLRTVRSGSKYKFIKGAVFTFSPPFCLFSLASHSHPSLHSYCAALFSRAQSLTHIHLILHLAHQALETKLMGFPHRAPSCSRSIWSFFSRISTIVFPLSRTSLVKS
jgi:hypothetical protein